MTTDFKALLSKNGPAALVLRQQLEPVEGPDGVFFPPTFAASEDDDAPAGYNIDDLGRKEDLKNVCIVDTVGSQANRIEPLFGESDYKSLVPQIVVKAGEKEVNLLLAGHRAADAIVRCSELRDDLKKAFKKLQSGDAEPLAKIAPTSLIFGVWDSRETQAKSPRLFASTIRAFDVHRLTRSASFQPAIDFIGDGLLAEATDKDTKKTYSRRGFLQALATATHGGVIATGGVRREVVFHLAALRAVRTGDSVDPDNLRAYLLGLGLVALTATAPGFLRSGCNLVPVHSRPLTVEVVHCDGSRLPFVCTHESALSFASNAARIFGVGESRTVVFDKQRVAEDLVDKKGKKGKKGEPK